MIILAIVSVIIAGAISTGCDSAQQNILDAEQKVREANENLATKRQQARDEAHKVKMAAEWEQYKAECELVIDSNERQIEELEIAVANNKKGYTAAQIARINSLKTENEQIKLRIQEYETDPSSWELFKTELKHDMDKLAEAFKDLTVNNTN